MLTKEFQQFLGERFNVFGVKQPLSGRGEVDGGERSKNGTLERRFAIWTILNFGCQAIRLLQETTKAD